MNIVMYKKIKKAASKWVATLLSERDAGRTAAKLPADTASTKFPSGIVYPSVCCKTCCHVSHGVETVCVSREWRERVMFMSASVHDA